ncbi:MAG: GntR family transcriptional regulator [Oscillospiraceae bacterium]|nr:GntR family transcriptional regulator [Oscillospiraceae bacterium]
MGWDFDSSRPIYAQLVEILKGRIISGRYLPGERLPSVRELAGEAGVNPNTMQRALAELERGGLVYTERTNGRFVTDRPEALQTQRQTTAREVTRLYLSQMAELGFTREDTVHLIETWNHGGNKDE